MNCLRGCCDCQVADRGCVCVFWPWVDQVSGDRLVTAAAVIVVTVVEGECALYMWLYLSVCGLFEEVDVRVSVWSASNVCVLACQTEHCSMSCSGVVVCQT